jgi:hypothetical protein
VKLCLVMFCPEKLCPVKFCPDNGGVTLRIFICDGFLLD